MYLLRQLALVFGGFLGLLLLAGCRAAATPVPTFTPPPTPTAADSVTSAALPSLTPRSRATPLPTATPMDIVHAALSRADQAAFVSETVPDYTTFAPGETFTKTWTLRNTGKTTWTTDYTLVRGESVPAGADWGAPPRVSLPHPVAPNEEVTLSASLTAPSGIGTSILHWALVNTQGEVVPVDGGRSVWTTIRVCAENLPCTTPSSQQTPSQDEATAEVELNGVSARLISLAADTQQTIAQLCITSPNNHYLIQPPIILQVDNQQFIAKSGGTLGPATSPTLCYMFAFPATEAQITKASRVAIIIQQVRMSAMPDPDERCQIVHDQLVGQYPGLDFTCHFSMAGYFTDLQVPEGLQEDQMRQLILDAIEGAINGPWVLRVR